jgi:hypothetical protein
MLGNYSLCVKSSAIEADFSELITSFLLVKAYIDSEMFAVSDFLNTFSESSQKSDWYSSSSSLFC